MEERFTKKNVRPKTKAPRSLGSDHAKHKSLKHTNVPRTSTNKAMVQKKQALAKGSSVEQIVTPIGNYTVKPIIPAEKPELLSVAKAMHREDMGSKLQTLFQPELNAAIEAIQTGKTTRLPCQTTVCPCRAFQFIPGRVEDIGEFWHQKRRDFDPLTWRAKCRCNHTHEDHECKTSLKRCKYPGCGCSAFISNFLCAACDQHWEKHETVFEIEEERKKHGIPYVSVCVVGEAYLPFEEMPNLRNMVLTGDETEPGPMYKAITNGRGPIPQGRAITQDTPVRMPKQNGLKPFWN
ncbi:protein FAM221B-like isoform X3 [Apostichopus japonicus]|uniref:protein FAM221B-like isoform X3 n=1 Tax=Stichopus japonicus TaxID=307972 RepID=UPI003AB5B957